MSLPVVPVTNGMIPRQSQELTGVFLDRWVQRVFRFSAAGHRGSVLLLPFNQEIGLYPVGSVAAVEDVWKDRVIVSPSFAMREALFARVVGKSAAKASGFCVEGGVLIAGDVEPVDLGALRHDYPLIDGAGWIALEGRTEARGDDDIRVDIYGSTHQGDPVTLKGNLGGLVNREVAHTIEHAILRSLSTCVMATPKTVRRAMGAEAKDLRDSLAAGYRFRMPEIFGVTSTGLCGNPLTGLAQFYLADEFRKNLRRGGSLPDSLEAARLSTLSKVTGDLELSTRRGERVSQGLKRGMMHDDSPVSVDLLKSVLRRFPLSPWE